MKQYNFGGKMYQEDQLPHAFPNEYAMFNLHKQQMALGGNIPQHKFGEWLSNAGDSLKKGWMNAGEQIQHVGRDAKDLVRNYGLSVADTAMGIVGADNVIQDSDYTGFGQKGARIGANVVGGIGKAILPTVANIVAPGSGQFVSMAQSGIGGFNPQDETINQDSTGQNSQPGLIPPYVMSPPPGRTEAGGIQFALGGDTAEPKFEAEGGEVIQGQGIQVNNGPGAPGVKYYAGGNGAMIEGNDHKGESTNPNSGVKMGSSGPEGRIFSKRLKNPETKKPFSVEADALLKKKEKYEATIKNKNSEPISVKTATIMKARLDGELDKLFAKQEAMKPTEVPAVHTMPDGSVMPNASMPAQGMQQMPPMAMAGQPMQEAMPQQALGGYIANNSDRSFYEEAGVRQYPTGGNIDGNAMTAGLATNAAASLPTAIFDLMQGYKKPVQWENQVNPYAGQVDENLGNMQAGIAAMPEQALKDYQASRTIYNNMGDLDISQQRADIKNTMGSQLNALRGGTGSRAEMLAGASSFGNQMNSQMGRAEAYKNQFDAEQQARKAAGLTGLGTSDASLRAQQAQMYGALAGQQNDIGYQRQMYAQYMAELARGEQDRRDAQKRSGWAGIGNTFQGAGQGMMGYAFNQPYYQDTSVPGSTPPINGGSGSSGAMDINGNPITPDWMQGYNPDFSTLGL